MARLFELYDDYLAKMIEIARRENNPDSQLATLKNEFISAVETQVRTSENINEPDEFGSNLLHAIIICQPEISLVEKVIELGIAVNATGKDGCSALHFLYNWFPYQGTREIFQLLLAEDIDITLTNSKGVSPLHLAADKGVIDHIDRYVALGGALDVADDVGNTRLHYAAQSAAPALRVFQSLLEKGADANYQNNNGDIPIHLFLKRLSSETTIWQSVEILKAFILRGFNPRIKNRQGLTPRDLFYQTRPDLVGNKEMIAFDDGSIIGNMLLEYDGL